MGAKGSGCNRLEDEGEVEQEEGRGLVKALCSFFQRESAKFLKMALSTSNAFRKASSIPEADRP